MAGVASLTAKICNQAKMPSICCYRPKDDPYQISQYYRSSRISNNPAKMLIQLIVIILQLKPRIVVIHYHQIVLFLRLFTTLCRLNITYIMQYHGSDIRIHGKKWYSKLLAHRFIFGTTDIIDGKLRNGTLLENPVDEELFYPTKFRKGGTAVYLRMKPRDCLQRALSYAEIYNLTLEVFDVMYRKEILDYRYMGQFLQQCHYYFDFKGLLPLSKTALEALACGCIVVDEAYQWVYPYQINNDAKIRRIVTYYALLCKS
jgi:hypothetical protein